jgi:hypothetical protein
MSCHFISNPEKSKDSHFYCPDRHTKYVEMRHVVFLEDEMMREIIVPQEISLEEKRIYVPTPMIHELISLVFVHKHIISTFEFGSSSGAPNVNAAPFIQEPKVLNVVIDE